MKLVQAIAFATQHNEFIQHMMQHHTNPDNAKTITIKIVNGDDSQFIYIHVYLDFASPGPGLGEVRIRVRYDRENGSYIFDDVLAHK